MKYDIVKDGYVVDLIRSVDILIADGWEPLGGIAINASGMLYQAMVKHERPEMQSGRINVKTGEITPWTRNADCISEAAKRYVIKVKNAEELPKVVRG